MTPDRAKGKLHRPGARKLALVTGASAGIGAAFARELAARGHDLALVARRVARLETLTAELQDSHGIAVTIIPADLAQPDSHRLIMAALGERIVTVLVNNAGLSIPEAFADTDWPRQRDCLMTLTLAVASLTHAVLPGMIARGEGRIITISSILALSQGGPGHTLYPAAKAFAHKFMLSLDAEVRGHGIVCTSVLPGTTTSEFREANHIALKAGGLAGLFTTTPEQVARAALDGNARSRLIVIPGLHNRLAAAAMKLAPDALIRWIGQRIA